MKLPDSNWPEDRVVDGVLQHRLAEALRHAAGHLAAHDQRVHRLADIVAHAVAHQFDDAGFRIDLHLGHVAAVGERVGIDRRDLGGIQQGRRLPGGGFFPLRRASAMMSMPRSVPTMENRAIGEGDVRDRGLQFLGRRLLALCDDGLSAVSRIAWPSE